MEKKIIFGGDEVLNSTHTNLLSHASDADVIIHECFSQQANDASAGEVNSTVNYFPAYHTSCYTLGTYAQTHFTQTCATLVLSHQMVLDPSFGGLPEIKAEVINGTSGTNGWTGNLINGNDLQVINPWYPSGTACCPSRFLYSS